MKDKETAILSSNELNESVKEYKDIFNSEIIDYLDSLIGLEISALNQGVISEDAIKRLNQIKLYRQIVIYNIYNKTLEVFKKYGKGLNLENGPKKLSVFVKDSEGNEYCIFNYLFNDKNIVSNYITLKQTIIDEAKRKEQIDRLYQQLETVKSSKKPPEVLVKDGFCALKKTKIKYIKELIKELENRSILNENTEYITDEQECFIKQVLGEQGLQVTPDFIEIPAFSASDIAMQSTLYNYYPYEVDRALTRKLVKIYPHTTISKVIKFY